MTLGCVQTTITNNFKKHSTSTKVQVQKLILLLLKGYQRESDIINNTATSSDYPSLEKHNLLQQPGFEGFLEDQQRQGQSMVQNISFSTLLV